MTSSSLFEPKPKCLRNKTFLRRYKHLSRVSTTRTLRVKCNSGPRVTDTTWARFCDYTSFRSQPRVSHNFSQQFLKRSELVDVLQCPTKYSRRCWIFSVTLNMISLRNIFLNTGFFVLIVCSQHHWCVLHRQWWR